MMRKFVQTDERKGNGERGERRICSSQIMFSNIYTANATTIAIAAYASQTW